MACSNCSTPCNCTVDPCSTDPIIPVCADPEYCEEIIADKCIIHKGAVLSNISAVDGARLDVILASINTKLGQEPNVTSAQIIALIESSQELKDAIIAAVNA